MWRKQRGIQCLLVLLGLLLLTGCSKDSAAKKQYEAGLVSLNSGELKEAIVSFKEALFEKPDDKDLSKSKQIINKKASYGLGVAYFRKQKYEKAEVYFEQARSIRYLEEWDGDIENYQVDTLCALEEYKRAYDLVLTLRDANKEDFSLLFREVFLLDALKEDKKRDETLNEGLLIKGHGNEYEFNLAKIQYMLGDLDKAKEGMEEASKKGIEEAQFYLGRIEEDDLNYKGAISLYKEYQASLSKQSDFVNLRIASCYEKQGDYESALDVYNSAIKTSDGTNLKELSYNQIILLEKNAQYKKAFKKCAAYLKKYGTDETMKKEYEFLETRVQYKE
ncbi:MAG: tetratricopeptide repeat protein [Velocimicrobium sp.]